VLKKIWADAVGSKLIANAIWYGGVYVAPLIVATMGWQPNITTITSGIGSFAGALTLVPNWLLVPICLVAVFGTFMLFKGVYHHIAGPDWHDYQRDTFYDVVWRWGYSSPDNKIQDLTPFCPDCDTQLNRAVEFGDNPDYSDEIFYVCSHCGNTIYVHDNYIAVLEKVSFQIERKCRQMGR
jgi:hypothetical protein